MRSKNHTDESSSSDSSYNRRYSQSRRRLPSPPSGILRHSSRHVTIVDPATISRKVDRITTSLEDTTRNLDGVDTKLSDYKHLHDDSMSALTRLQEDLEGSIHKLRRTREKRSAAQDASLPQTSRRSVSLSRGALGTREYESDITDYAGAGKGIRRSSSTLGMYDPTIRDKVHDLSAGQQRLEDDLSSEIQRRRKAETAAKRQRGIEIRNPTDRVEMRLKEIEREMARERDHAAQIASDVAEDVLRRSQLVPQPVEDLVMKNRLLEVEARKRAVECDLESTRRRLEQSEGGKEALTAQIGELRSLINKSDKDRDHMQRQIEQFASSQKMAAEREEKERMKMAAVNRMEHDRQRQQDEIDDLRGALKRSTGVVQLDETRRELEKSERQRQHLSDHIEVLTKDLEKKDQANSRLLNQHHDLQRALELAEKDKERATLRLEDALTKLKEQTRDTEKYVKELNRSEQSSAESEKEKEELRTAAQDTIRQWKAKCRKNEKEIERLEENISTLSSRNEAVVKENIASKMQANNAFQQAENLRTEMDNLIAKRADQDEQLRRRDKELEEGSEERRVLIGQLKDTRDNGELLEKKIGNIQEKLDVLKVKLANSEADVRRLSLTEEGSKKKNEELQSEVRQLKLAKNETENRLRREEIDRAALAKTSEDASKQLSAASLELSSVKKQLQIEREQHKKELNTLQSEIHTREVEKIDGLQRVSKKADEERCFLEGEIHRVNMDTNEARAALRESQKQLGKLRDELKEVENERLRLARENMGLKERCLVVTTEFEGKCSEVARESGRLQEAEDALLKARDRSRRLEQEIETARTGIENDVSELEGVVGVISLDTTSASAISNLDASISESWSQAVRRRLNSIRKEMKALISKNSKRIDEIDRQKQQAEAMCRTVEDDRRQLMSEVTEQNKLVDSLSKERTSLMLENKEARFVMQDLEDKVANLTQDLQLESMKERERIAERYNRYKSTMNQLQAELDTTSSKRSKPRTDESSLITNGARSPSPIRRVTIADTSPIIHGYSLPQRSSSPKHRIAETDR